MRRVFAALVFAAALSANASTYVVDDSGDAGDVTPGDNICDSDAGAAVVCTLRAAIEEANAHTGPDSIEFSIADVFLPATAYPPITETLSILGQTAPGYAGEPLIVIDGAVAVADGLHFADGADDSVLDALWILGFTDAGVRVDADGVSIWRNYIGDVDSGENPNDDGLELAGDNATVGGEDGLGNVISGNTFYGIWLTGSNNRISDNHIGTNPAGTASIENEVGIFIDGTAANNTIGGTTDGDVNLISGNYDAGVVIAGGTNNTIAGNHIGLNAAGTAAIPNFTGVAIGSDGNIIGTAATKNVISGNEEDGVGVFAAFTTVQNNIIGLDPSGTVAIPNGASGIWIVNTTNVDIGGSGPNERNVISGNGFEGIAVAEAEAINILHNIVGLDATGTNGIGNGAEGILLLATFDVVVGSNIVSDNGTGQEGGGGIVDAGGDTTIIESNYVGTSADGSTAIGNSGTGVEVFASIDAIVRSNVVSDNDGHGIETTAGSIGTLIYLNIAGLSADLSTPMGNALDGINVCDSAEDTVVGSVALGGNIISANDENGIGVEPTALTNNTWAANSIYDNGLLGIDIGIDGVTANDENDLDEGANNYQNFPELDTAVTTASASQVRGTIDTLPNATYTVHFYSSPAADPSGFGEGRTYLGAVSGTTDANGDASFTFNGPALTVGHVVTATGTTIDGTSEFSAALAVNAAPVVSFSMAAYSVGEGDGSATITVTRSGDLSAPSTVDYATSNDSATAGSDYTSTNGTLTFAPGDASESFVVPILNDTADEPAEVIDLTLSNAVAATPAAPSTATLTINDDDLPPTISIANVAQPEGTSPFEFAVTLSAASGFTVTVDYAAAAGGTATAGSDYTAIGTTTLTFAPGATTQTVSVNVTSDNVVEPDETFVVNLTNPQNATITDNQGLGTIQNDDAATLTIGDVSLAEGDGGTTNFVFTVTSNGVSATDININYSTANDTATAADYTAQSGTATIAAGTTSTTITVPVTGELLVEVDETFFVNLLSATGATIIDNQGLGTIGNDDAATLTIGDVSLAEGDADTTNFVFTVTSNAVSATDININYSTANDTATAADYTAQSGTATVAAGTTSTTITVPVTGELLVEGDETFFVNLISATGATITDNQGLGTIENDDAATLTIDDVSLAEGNAGTTNFVFTVTSNAVSATDIDVNYSTASDTATADDYTAQSGTATITAGTTSTTITVPVTGDMVAEPDETFFVNLTGATGATIADNQGLGTIENDDAATLTIDDVSLAEGDAGTTNFVFTVTSNAVSATDMTVNYSTANDTATAADYTAQSGMATITAGMTSTTITVPVIGDVVAEPDETFFVNLTGATGASILDNQGLGTIQNDEGVPTITIGDLSLAEGNGGTTSFVFTITASGTSASDITVNYATANDAALAGSDYTAQSGLATIAAGTTSTTITVPVTGETLFENDETFFVNLSGATSAAIADAQALGTIENDDAQPAITIDDAAQAEGDAGTSPLSFTIRLNAASGIDLNVNYATANDTATAGNDYSATSGTATIPAGSTSTTIDVSILGDTLAESNETFFVNLAGATNATIADNQALGTIANDDGQPLIAVDDVSLEEGDAGTTDFVFTISLSEASGDPVTVSFTTAAGTAASGTDFIAQTNVAVIPPGSTSTTVTIEVVGDVASEPDETFFVNLSTATNATIGDAQGQGTILDDDAGADLSISKTTNATTFVPGQQITYTITVTNAGPATASGITVTDALPAGATFVSATGTAGSTCTGTTIVVCTIPTLAGAASSTITLVVTATGSAPISNTATVQAVTPADPAAGNNTGSVTINLAAATAAAAIPTASEWGLMMLAMGLVVLAMRRI